MPVFVFYDFRIIRYRKWVIKQMDASLFEGAMGMVLPPNRDGIAAKVKTQDNDAGFPIGSGMTEESGGLGKGRAQTAT